MAPTLNNVIEGDAIEVTSMTIPLINKLFLGDIEPETVEEEVISLSVRQSPTVNEGVEAGK